MKKHWVLIYGSVKHLKRIEVEADSPEEAEALVIELTKVEGFTLNGEMDTVTDQRYGATAEEIQERRRAEKK